MARPAWTQALLSSLFVVACIVMAPLVGQIADHFVKKRVMIVAHLIKFFGAALIACGFDIFAGYALVGVGAALYSPVKYGILRDLLNYRQLVKGNGWMEGTTILAILLGSITGGLMTVQWLNTALLMLPGIYIITLLLTCFIDPLTVTVKRVTFRSIFTGRVFINRIVLLCSDHEALLSLLGSSLFWGAGSVLRLLLVIWLPPLTGLEDQRLPGILSGVIAVGTMVGASLAAGIIRLESIQRCMPVGMCIGVFWLLWTVQSNIWSAGLLLFLIGAAGGFYLVPMNALLQSRGNAVAIQNMVENITMLLALAIYGGLLWIPLPAIDIAIIFGFIFTLIPTMLWWLSYSRHRG